MGKELASSTVESGCCSDSGRIERETRKGDATKGRKKTPDRFSLLSKGILRQDDIFAVVRSCIEMLLSYRTMFEK